MKNVSNPGDLSIWRAWFLIAFWFLSMESESNCIYKCLQKHRAAGRTPPAPLQGSSLHIHTDTASVPWAAQGSHTIQANDSIWLGNQRGGVDQPILKTCPSQLLPRTWVRWSRDTKATFLPRNGVWGTTPPSKSAGHQPLIHSAVCIRAFLARSH